MMLMEHEEGRGHVRSMLAALTLAEARNEAAKDTLSRTPEPISAFCGSIYKRKMRFCSGSPMMSFLRMSKNSCCDPSKSMRLKR